MDDQTMSFDEDSINDKLYGIFSKDNSHLLKHDEFHDMFRMLQIHYEVQAKIRRGLPPDYVVTHNLKPTLKVARILVEYEVQISQQRIDGKIRNCVHIARNFDKMIPLLSEIPHIGELGFYSIHEEEVPLTGDHLLALTAFKELRTLRINAKTTRLPEESLSPLLQLPHLRELTCDDFCNINLHIPVIANLIKLEQLEISPFSKKSTLNDKSLVLLGNLTNLKRFVLADLMENIPVKVSSIQALSSMKNLQVLSIVDTNISDNNIMQLGNMPQLEELNLCKSIIGDRALEVIGGYSNLRVLFIQECPNITSKGILHLQSLNKLETLFIDGNNVTGEVIVMLSHLPALKSLDTMPYELPKSQIDNLLKRNPKLRIFPAPEPEFV